MPPCSTSGEAPLDVGDRGHGLEGDGFVDPESPAATAATAALARLHRPGSARRTGRWRPSAVTSTSPRSSASGAGRRKPHGHDQSSPAKTIRPAHAGTTDGVVAPQLSGRHPHHLGRALRPPHHERVVGIGDDGRPRHEAERALRQRAATMRTSLTRSSWSRDRLSRATTSGCTASATAPRYPSSTSSTAGSPGGAEASAVASPRGRLAPAGDVATARRRCERRRQQPGRGGLAVGPGDEGDGCGRRPGWRGGRGR